MSLIKNSRECTMRIWEGVNRNPLSPLVLAMTALALSPAAWSQITPGQVTDTLKRPIELKQPEAAQAAETQKATKPAPTGGKGKTVTLVGVEFTGNTVYPAGELVALLKDYLNKPVTLLDIYAAADRVAAHYVANGYTLASVNVPPQKISDGVVQLEVTEGRISNVKLEGASNYRVERIQAYLDAAPNSIYRSDEVDAGMRRLNDLPGLRARMIVQPGAEYGTSEVVIKAEEKPITGALFADNYGRESIGKRRVAAMVSFNNPFGVEDQLQVLGLLGSESLLNYYYAAYSLPLNDLGTRVAFSYGHAGFTVLQPVRIDGRTDNGKVEVQHPLLRTATSRSDLTVGVARYMSESFTGPVLSGSSISLFELGATFNHLYSNLAVTQVVANISSNFDRMTANDVNTAPLNAIYRADQLFRGELDLQHLQPLFAGIQAVAHFNGVWSPYPLPDATSYSIGGPQSVRGYAPAEVRGDRGYFGQLTLQRRFTLGDFRFTPRVFADSGWVECADSNACIAQAAGAGTTRQDSLTSVGVGTDIDIDTVSLKFDWSRPQDGHRSSDGRNDDRLYGSVFVSF